jgi:hypothetical protein
MTAQFEPEIEEAAREIAANVAAGNNDPFGHALSIADAIERLLEKYFPDLPTANSLDPRETVDSLLQFYAAIHEDGANQPDAPAPNLPALL